MAKQITNAKQDSLVISSFREIREQFKAFQWDSDNSTKDGEKTRKFTQETLAQLANPHYT
jgi:hypothetical protein